MKSSRDKLLEALWEDYEENTKLISDQAVDSNEYRSFKDERDRIRKELVEVVQMEENEINKEKELKSVNRNEIIRNSIKIGSIIITSLISIYSLKKTFKFDEDATLTSTLGKGIVRDTATKIFRIKDE